MFTKKEVGEMIEKGETVIEIVNVYGDVVEEVKMPVWVTDDPQTAVVRGCGVVLENQGLLNKVRVVGGLR